MTDPLDLDAMERGSLSSTARRLITELRQTRKERDEALEKVHFYEVQYQDEIGINGLIEERDAALATVTEQKAEIERLKVQLEDELVATSQSDRERAKQLIKELCGGEPVADDDSDIEPTARVLAAIRREESERIDRPERQALDEAVRALSKISDGYIEAGTNRDATQEYAAQIVVAIRKLVPNAGGRDPRVLNPAQREGGVSETVKTGFSSGGIEVDHGNADLSACLRDGAVEIAIGEDYSGDSGYARYLDFRMTLDEATRFSEWLSAALAGSKRTDP